jgi:hypothetical protein
MKQVQDIPIDALPDATIIMEGQRENCEDRLGKTILIEVLRQIARRHDPAPAMT